MRRIITPILVLFTVLVIAAWPQTAGAQVQPAAYSNKSLKGPYSFLVNNWLSNPSDSPVGHLGIVNFDGAGNLTITDTINVNGTVGTFTGTGTYSLAKNGTGTASFTLPTIGLSVTNAIVADSGGKSAQILMTSCTGCSDTTDVYSGTAFAMGASSFTNASVKGTYEWSTAKWTSSANSTAEGRLYTVTFDGVSKVSLSGTIEIGNETVSETASGTYSVNSDGSGSMNMSDASGNTFTAAFVANSASATGLDAKGLQHMTTAWNSSDFESAIYDGTATKSAPTGYSNKSLKGPYSFLLNRWLSNPSDNPTGTLGIMNADGAGDLTVSITTIENGTVVTSTGTGTYSIAKNGTGTLSITFPAYGTTYTSAVVLDSAGKSAQILQTSCTGCSDNTDVSSGTAFAMGASSFTNASLKGSYEIDTEKWTSSQSPTAECRLGTATFDGVGNVTLSDTDVWGGEVTTDTVSGTYTVNSDGSGVMNMDPSSPFTISIVVNSASATGLGAKGIQHLTTASTSSLTGFIYDGTGTKQ